MLCTSRYYPKHFALSLSICLHFTTNAFITRSTIQDRKHYFYEMTTDGIRHSSLLPSKNTVPKLMLESDLDSDLSWKTELNSIMLQDIVETAESAAFLAGQIIVDNLGCSSEMQNTEEFVVKTSIKDIVTKYDKQAQSIIEGIIREKHPNHGFLGEEDVEPGPVASEQALMKILNSSKDFVWICDPIDGTANFASGLNLCAVTMGVVYKGVPIVGVVFDPHAREIFTAIKGKGARVRRYYNLQNSKDYQEKPLQVAVSIENVKDAIINAGCPADASAFDASMRGMKMLNGKARGIRMIACSALTTAWIASGRLTAHFGYDLSSWDLIAGALLIQEAGGLVTDLNGTPYKLTTRNMLCSNGNEKIHSQILDILKSADAIDFVREK